MRRIAVLDAPSNLGLRPPTATSVPGCAKAPGALRDHGLLHRLNARDAGCLTPPRYDPGDWRPGDGVCHAPSIAAYSRALADRIGAIIDAGEFPVVLGGDCSIVLGSGLAMHRLGEEIGGRIGLVFVDGHSDFRHPGNASYVGAAAGEDLALVTGRGQADLAAMEGRRPYFRDIDVVVMGIRAHDEYRLDLQAAGIVTRPVPMLRAEGAARSAQWARDQLVDCAGYWVHVDMDVLDPAVMPAVDAPEPGGIAFPELELLLAGLVDTPHCLGVEITVFDPDYDTDGSYAEEITSTLVAGLAPVSTPDAPTPTDRTQVRARDDADNAAEAEAEAAAASSAAAAAVASAADAAAAASAAAAVVALAGPLDGARPGGLRPGGLRPGGLWADAAGEGGLRATGSRADEPGPEDASLTSPRTGVLRAGVLRASGLRRDGLSEIGLGQGVAGRLRRPAAAGAEPGATEPGARVPDAEETDAGAPGTGESFAPESEESADQATPGAALTFPAALLEGSTVDSVVEPEPVDEVESTDEPSPVDPHDRADHHKPQDGEWVDEFAVGEDHIAWPVDPESPELSAPDPVDPPESELSESELSESELDRSGLAESDADHTPAGTEHVGASAEDIEHGDDEQDNVQSHLAERPLGLAPLLDSEPLPATMPGTLRPRPMDAFSLPTQRPAFDVGPEKPADIT